MNFKIEIDILSELNKTNTRSKSKMSYLTISQLFQIVLLAQ